MNTTDSTKFDVQAFQTPAEARAAAAALIAHAADIEVRGAAAAGLRIFDITSYHRSQSATGYVVLSRTRIGGELVPWGLGVQDRDDLFVGKKWDSNWNVRKNSKMYREQPEFDFEVLARATFLSEFEGVRRYIEID